MSRGCFTGGESGGAFSHVTTWFTRERKSPRARREDELASIWLCAHIMRAVELDYHGESLGTGAPILRFF